MVFSVGQNTSTSCITIAITNDERIEGDQNFTVSITTAESAAVETPSVVIVTVIDDDGMLKYYYVENQSLTYQK